MRSSRRTLLARRGQALVEFALVFPIFILLIVALVDVGRAVFAYNTITNAAREGARLAIVNQDLPSIRARTVALSISLGVAPADVTVTYRDDGLDPLANSVCGTPELGCVAIVEVPYTWQAITPLIGQLIGPRAMRAQSVFPIEYVCPNTAIPNAANCPRQP